MNLGEKDKQERRHFQLVARGKAKLGEMRTGPFRRRSARRGGNPDMELSPIPRQHPENMIVAKTKTLESSLAGVWVHVRL